MIQLWKSEFSRVLRKKAVAESLGFTVVPILEDKVEEFERAANNDKKSQSLFSLSAIV